jgi:ferric-dicitrate binding protein FerR (iron transport regulator)
MRVSDGTTVELAPGGRAAVSSRSRAGADVRLLAGRARFAVVHRAGARWRAMAGPVTVDVTGTKFELAWGPAHQAIAITLHEGAVRVSGGSLSLPRVLRRAETLEVTLEATPAASSAICTFAGPLP